MSGAKRPLSLAAGTVRDVARTDAVDAAGAAGFDAVGLRFDLDPPTTDELTALRERLRSTGLEVLDVEVVRLSPTWDEELELRLIEWAHELGARHLLVVSDDPERNRSLDGLRRVAERCRTAGLSAVLEFMKFTHPKTLDEAVSTAREVGPELGGVLLDPLHLSRSGGDPRQIADYESELFPYAQLCDAPERPAAWDEPALVEEARHHRLLPGLGDLPLREFLEALPEDLPLSLEVQSDALERDTTARERAHRGYRCVRALAG